MGCLRGGYRVLLGDENRADLASNGVIRSADADDLGRSAFVRGAVRRDAMLSLRASGFER